MAVPWSRSPGPDRAGRNVSGLSKVLYPGSFDPLHNGHVEIVEIDSGEVVLFWDTTPAQTGRLSRALKGDLAQLEADEFLARWRRYETQ